MIRARLHLAALLVAALLPACRAKPAPPAQPSSTASAEPPSTPAVPACNPPNVRFVPPSEAPAEVTLILLHGYGGESAHLERVARALAKANPHLAVIVPDGCDPFERGDHGRQWWALRDGSESDRGARLRAAAGRVEAMVEAEIAKRHLPRDRRAWAGFSQGAMLAEWMALHATPRPVAVVAFSGRFDDDAPPAAPVGTPVLLVHGTQDERIPFPESDRAEQALRARGARVERLDRPGMGHTIDHDSVAGAVAFLAQHLGPAQ